MAQSRLRRAILTTLWVTPTVALVFVFVLLATLPWFAPLIPLPTIDLDLAKDLPPDVAALVTNKTASAKLSLTQSRRGGLLLTARGQALDWPFTLKVDADYSLLTLSANATADFAFDDSDFRLSVRAQATPCTWRADAEIPETSFDEKEAFIASLLSRIKLNGVSDLAFGATLGVQAKAEKTRLIPVPVWTAKAKLTHGRVSAVVGELPLTASEINLSLGADGIADRTTLKAILPRVKEITVGDMVLKNFNAAIRPSERGLFVNEASVGFCGGEVKVYSLFLDPASLTAGFTLFLDDIDAGEIMRQIKGFNGEATGRLHGKLPLFLKNGVELRLKDAYLYSTPGETGSIRVADPSPILDNLAMSGVDAATCNNLGKALADLLYHVLKLELKRDVDGQLALGLKVEGSSTHGRTTVPVSFSVTFHGDIEQLINTGLKLRKN